MRPLLFLATFLAVSACDTGVETRTDAKAVPVVAAPLTQAAGPETTLTAATDVNLQWAASVVQLDVLKSQGDATVKLFGTAGGDPAMNGLYTYIAFFQSPAEGWRVFQIGDVLSYRVLSESAGRVDLELNESTHDAATGTIGSRTRRVIVKFAMGVEGQAPETVIVAPAA